MNALFIHYPTDVEPGSWELKPNAMDGHILPHFRKDSVDFFESNLESSLKKFKIDFEYFLFVLKNYTNYCI